MILNDILAHVPCPVFWKDLNGKFLGCNKQFLSISGFTNYNQLIGKIDAELPWSNLTNKYHVDDQYVITTEQTITRIESITLHYKTIMSETTKTPLMQNNKITGILGICLDITAQKEVERLKIEQAEHQAEKLQIKESIIKEVAQAIHDIRSPVATISATLDNMKSQMTDEQHANLTTQLERVLQIADSFLDFNRNPSIALNKNQKEVAYHRLSSLLNSIIEQKHIEWLNKCTIRIISQPNELI